MERTCENCPYHYVNGFKDYPVCNKDTDNEGECWADDNEYVTIGATRYVVRSDNNDEK